jgi:hypothetical protein
LASIIDYTSNQEARSALGRDSNFPQKAQFTAHNIRLDDGGGCAVEFARLGFQSLDQPRRCLDMLSKATCRVLMLDTHFSEAKDFPSFIQPRKLHRFVTKSLPLRHNATTTHKLGYLTEHEALQGRWFSEFLSNRTFRDRANRRLASRNNRSSFWIQREYLIGAIKEAGFDLVLEQFDGLAPNIAQAMTRGRYRINGRGTFIGIKTASAADHEPRYLGSSPLRSTPLS